MKRRKLVGSYGREHRMRTQGINRFHGLFLAQGITDVVKRDLATEEVRAETVKELRGLEREEADHLVACIHCGCICPGRQ
jgi:hypothetical protein